jgi:hypothetical protein
MIMTGAFNLTFFGIKTKKFVTHAAAILTECKTSTEQMENPSVREEITTTKEGFMCTVSDFYNISFRCFEIFRSPFHISHYKKNSTEDFAYENAIELQLFPYTVGFPHDLGPTALELRKNSSGC